MLSKFYINSLIDVELAKVENTRIIFYDEPDSNLSKVFIYDQLSSKLKKLRKTYQIFVTTHEPILIINTDSNRIIHCENNDTIEYGSKFSFKSAPISRPEENEKEVS